MMLCVSVESKHWEIFSSAAASLVVWLVVDAEGGTDLDLHGSSSDSEGNYRQSDRHTQTSHM